MDEITNFVIVGVGGQGILLASAVISEAVVLAGFDVKSNEVHGMAQRGGSVISQIRFGSKVYSPLVQEGSAHFVISLEKLETLRYFKLYNKETKVVVNNLEIVPVTVTSGTTEYAQDIDSVLKKSISDLHFVDAENIARKAGNVRAANVVLIGAMSNYLSFDDELFERAIENSVKKQYIDLNIKSFHLGKDAPGKK